MSVRQLQLIQNAEQEFTPAFRSLHWLTVTLRIERILKYYYWYINHSMD